MYCRPVSQEDRGRFLLSVAALMIFKSNQYVLSASIVDPHLFAESGPVSLAHGPGSGSDLKGTVSPDI